jgi:hypothetical protein
VFDRSAPPHTHTVARMRSNVHLYVRTQSTLDTYALSMSAVERTYMRSNALEASCDLFLGHFSSPFPHFIVALYASPLPSPFLSSQTPPNSLKSKTHCHPSLPHHPPYHCWPFCITHTHRWPPFSPPFFHFFHKNPKPNFFKSPLFFSFFLLFLGTNPLTDCAPFFVLDWCVFARGWAELKRVPKPFCFGLHTRCSIKGPNEPPACLEGEVHCPSHPGSMPL